MLYKKILMLKTMGFYVNSFVQKLYPKKLVYRGTDVS